VLYGKYTIDLYDGPIYVEEIRESDKNGGKLTFTLGEFGKKVQEIHIPIKDYIKEKKAEEEVRLSKKYANKPKLLPADYTPASSLFKDTATKSMFDDEDNLARGTPLGSTMPNGTPMNIQHLLNSNIEKPLLYE
jgi:hypothetical protein